MDKRNLCVFDFETSSRDPATTQILQIGSLILDSKTFAVKDKFQSLVRPDDFDALEDEALDVNGLTRQELSEAPSADMIFPTWVKWIQKYNVQKNLSTFGAPIPVHYGGDNFDMPIFNRYCKKYDYWDNKWGNQTVLNPIFSMDVLKHVWLYTRINNEVKRISLPIILEYMGVPKEEIEKGAHDAMWDVEWTAKIAVKFLKFAGYITEVRKGKRLLNLKGCFK